MFTQPLIILSFWKIFVISSKMDFEPHNLICQKYENYYENLTCEIRPSKESPKALNFIGSLKKPITNAQVKITFFKNSIQFPADITFDACKALEGKGLNPITSTVRNAIMRHSNFNQSCPIQGTVHVLDFAPKLNLLPMFLPGGKFSINFLVTNGKNNIVEVRADFLNNRDTN